MSEAEKQAQVTAIRDALHSLPEAFRGYFVIQQIDEFLRTRQPSHLWSAGVAALLWHGDAVDEQPKAAA